MDSRSFILEISPAARRDLRKLPREVQEQIVFNHLPIIERDPLGAGNPLIGTLKGERSYHFGRKPEYRIIYFLEGQTITVTIIGTRESIYKKAKRRR